MKKIYQITAACAYMLMLLTTGCTDDPTDIAPEDAKISFYNASQLLRKEVESKNVYVPTKPAFILLNTSVPVKPDTLPPLQMKDYPFFALSVNGQQMYPIPNNSTTTIPWTSYMRIAPGHHEISFLKTDTTLAATAQLNVPRAEETTVFLADSMGEYHTIVTNDTHAPFEKGFSLRMVHAVSDTGRLMFKVNSEWQKGDWGFGETSPFFDIPMADSLQSQLVRISLSPAADTSAVINRLIVKCSRGEIYTLIPNGYIESREAGNWQADFKFSIIRNK